MLETRYDPDGCPFVEVGGAKLRFASWAKLFGYTVFVFYDINDTVWKVAVYLDDDDDKMWLYVVHLEDFVAVQGKAYKLPLDVCRPELVEAWDGLTFLGGDAPYYLGLEIELEYPGVEEAVWWAYYHLYDGMLEYWPGWYFQHDDSLRNGCEFTSFPGTYSYWMEYDWEGWASNVANVRFEARKTCGMHVHVSRSALSESGWMKVGYFVHSHPRLIEELAGRQSNTYCEIKPGKAFLDSAKSEDRYEAVNFTNEDTVEFRFFASSTDPEVIRGNLRVVHALVEFGRVAPIGLVMSPSRSEEFFMELLEREVS